MSNLTDAKIFVAGHRGMVGGAILRRCSARGGRGVTSSPAATPNLT
jgi:nucleoside-diphosphate-sugar epimerase